MLLITAFVVEINETGHGADSEALLLLYVRNYHVQKTILS
jgi:hypothetical protein